MILLGTNDHNMFGHGYAMLAHNTALIAERVRCQRPDAQVLPPALARHRQPKASVELTGSFASGRAWITKPRIHFSPEGGYLIARKVHEVLRELGPTPPPQETLTERRDTKGHRPHLGHIGFWLAADGPLALDAQGRATEWRTVRGESIDVQSIADACPTFVENAVMRFPTNGGRLQEFHRPAVVQPRPALRDALINDWRADGDGDSCLLAHRRDPQRFEPPMISARRLIRTIS